MDNRPNETQIAGAMAVLKSFAQQGGAAAAENVTRQAVYSMMSCLGGKGVVAGVYAEAVKAAMGDEMTITSPVTKVKNGVYKISDNPYGIVPGTYYSEDSVFESTVEEPNLDPDTVTEATLDDMTKAQLASSYGVSDDQTKEKMIAEILGKLNNADDIDQV